MIKKQIALALARPLKPLAVHQLRMPAFISTQRALAWQANPLCVLRIFDSDSSFQADLQQGVSGNLEFNIPTSRHLWCDAQGRV